MSTIGNTTSTPYLDSFNKLDECKNDRNEIAKHCAAKPEDKKKEERARQSGLRRQVKKVLGALDDTGKKIYGYRKGFPATNGWMDDHCDGLWVKPQLNGLEDFQNELAAHKQRFDNLSTTAKYYLDNPSKMAESGFEQFIRQAADELGPDQIQQMALNKLGKDALLSLVPVGKGGALAKLGQALKSGVSVSSYLDTAGDLAKAVQNPATLELLDDMKFLASEAKNDFANAVSNWQEKPDAAMAEAMSIAAYMDPCIRARKCQLVPFSATEKQNTDKGNGCCPGQTGHHLIPDSAVKDAKCKHQKNGTERDYSYGGAPTLCLEGQDNSSGTHGRAHQKLKQSMDDWRSTKGNFIPYDKMRDKALKSVSHATRHCNEDCLQAQLDSYYQKCEDLKAVAGSNSDPKIPGKERTPTPKMK